MEDEACTWALPYLEELLTGGSPFTRDYGNFVTAFNKRFTPHDSTETVRDALKHIKQGKNSVAEYQVRFNQFTTQTGWSDANHRTRFYDSLSEAIKDSLAITDQLTRTLTKLKKAAQVLDQRMRQQMAEKAGKSLHPTTNTTSKKSNAMEVDATRQQQQAGKKVWNRKTYLAFMKGKCYGCGSTDHTKANRNHKQDICNHCRKVGHRSPVCQSKYLGKPAAEAAATEQEQLTPSTSKGKALVSTTTPALAKDSKGQANLLAQCYNSPYQMYIWILFVS